jgi:hypothetical protein
MMWLVGLALAVVLCMLVLGGQFWMLSATENTPNHPLRPYTWTPLMGFLLLPACFVAMIQAARRRTRGWFLTSLPASLPFVCMVGFAVLLAGGHSLEFVACPYLQTPLNALAYFAVGHVAGVILTYLKAHFFPRRA